MNCSLNCTSEVGRGKGTALNSGRAIRILPRGLMAAAMAMGGMLLSAGVAPAAAPAPAAHRVAEITLEGPLLSRPQGFSFSLFNLGPVHQPSLTGVMSQLTALAKNPSVDGVFLNLKSFSLSLTQAQEVDGLIRKLRRAHKQVAVYASNYDTNTYLLASSADTVIMARHGDMFLPGVALQLMFFKGILAKFHIHADMVQIGKFKGAEEPLTRESASPAFAAQIQGLVNAWYSQIVRTIAHNRKIAPATVKAAINNGWMGASAAKKIGLIDKLLAPQQVKPWLENHFTGGCVLVRHVHGDVHQPVDLSSPLALFQLLGSPSRHKSRSNKPAIAVICADGVIMDNSPSNSENDAVITPAMIRRQVNRALRNSEVKAIVLRVDSPGGSAEASEDIWQILHAAGTKKPLSVSMGAEAASGGYYISTAGASITADPGTIAGSIGVVGGKVVYGNLLKKVGIGVETFSKGKNAGLFSPTQSFTPDQRTYVTQLMRRTYALFTRRVMEARHGKIAHIQAVARGRLFAGQLAVKAGLVDRVGSLDSVIAAAAATAHISGKYQVLVYPQAHSLAQVIRRKLGISTELPMGLNMIISALPRPYRNTAAQMMELVDVLQANQVMLAAPVGFVEK